MILTRDVDAMSKKPLQGTTLFRLTRSTSIWPIAFSHSLHDLEMSHVDFTDEYCG
jgi:hypothetical protein